jgi:hypothetical protein
MSFWSRQFAVFFELNDVRKKINVRRVKVEMKYAKAKRRGIMQEGQENNKI